MEIRQKLGKLAEKNALLSADVKIFVSDTKLDVSRIKDYPLMRGKEILLRAVVRDCYGDAFTDRPTEFVGSLREALEACERPALVALLNAVMRCLGMVDKTVHCHGNEPERCATILVEKLKSMNVSRIGIIGFQPAFVKEIAHAFGPSNVMVSDMNPENIGKVKYGVIIVSEGYNEVLMENSDIVLATGSSFVNGTYREIYETAKRLNKRIIFYGTSIAGASKLLGLERFCALAR